MADDTPEPFSPKWWLLRLGAQLTKQQPRFDRLEAYAIGIHPLPVGHDKMRETFQRFQRMARANFTGLVAESVKERLQVVGFSTGSSGDGKTDAEAWKCWQRNQLDADSGLVHQFALEMSRAYVIVGKDADGKAVITGEDPRQVITAADPVSRRKVRAALKHWKDDDGKRRYATVYLPDGVYYFAAPLTETGAEAWNPAHWEPFTAEVPAGQDAPVLNGVVPVVPFINRPRLRPYGSGIGEFEDVLDIQDRINAQILDRLVISAMQAYRQRWAKGVKFQDEHGNKDVFDPGADLVWDVEAPDAAFGSFEQTDLGPILAAAKEDIRQLAAISRTPPHYLVGELNNVNGETLKATETGLVAKCFDRKRHFGEAWEEVNRIAGDIEGREVAEDSEVLWADSESRTLAELADAAVKQGAAGVPWRQVMRLLQFSPQEIDRMESERMMDALTQSVANPGATSPAPIPPA